MSAISEILKYIRLQRMERLHQQFNKQEVEDLHGETIMHTVVSFCLSHGAHPFIIPAMGSHAGATAEGQRNMLAALGVTEKSCGCPIVSSM